MRSRPATIAASLLTIGLLTAVLAFAAGAGTDADGPTEVRAAGARERIPTTTTSGPTSTTATTPSTTTAPAPAGSEAADRAPAADATATPGAPVLPPLQPTGPLADPLALFGGATSPTPSEGSSVRLVADPGAAGVAADFTIGGLPAPSPFDPGFGYTAGQGGCSLSCITSGLAWPAARSAELRVETNTPARIWITVWRGSTTWVESTTGHAETSFSATFDDLQPNTTYQAMAVAQDANGHSDHRYGSFTTRGEKLRLTLDTGVIHELPDDDVRVPEDLTISVWVNGQGQTGLDGPLPLLDTDDPIDVRLGVSATHEDLGDGFFEHCEATGPSSQPPSTPGGFDPDHCATRITVANWNTFGQIQPLHIGGSASLQRTLTIAPGFDVDFVVTVGLTVERVPA